ncbi:hypothetical protein NEF87_000515 [Candidatus Lokiarchaeum ossiferum]|uniref:Gram-positive cocci surface proteins LPxTG domain-containing protein n=1 Tax=Candidatus Lokiarchaeum ossiferum TaxID=2951803 RepID=A0ABY6HL34_9ARCH|nr:hypothetical protein NEF87_000515 [Candidatus Lokiarchaeum sp. B-35]
MSRYTKRIIPLILGIVCLSGFVVLFLIMGNNDTPSDSSETGSSYIYIIIAFVIPVLLVASFVFMKRRQH